MSMLNQTRLSFAASCVAALLLISSSPQPMHAQSTLTTTDLVKDLVGLEATSNIDVAMLRRLAEDRIRQDANKDPRSRPPIAQQLFDLPQLTIEIQFNFDSSIIKPESLPALGRIADTLYHPYLLGYRFLIVGHTDVTGKRSYNLKLSQQRADAIREALVTTFRIAPERLLAVGLGEEQLRDRERPEASVNRRVQLVTIGRLR